MTTLLIGTYPAAGAGTPAGLGEGVWRVELDDATGALGDARLLAELPAPSFLAATDGRVHAVLEAEDGLVATLAPDGERLHEVARVASGGVHPCHVVPLPGGEALAVANYSSGALGVVPLDGGSAAEPVKVHGHAGHGPRADRQEGPHAHFVAVAPGGRHVLVVDLGTDEIRRYAVTDDGLRPAGVAATLPPGTGPRHLDFAAGHVYVAGELDVRVHVLAWDEQTATGAWVGAVPAVVGVDVEGDDLPSHLAVDGDDVVVTVRGSDVVTRYAIAPDGSLTDGRSTPLGGGWPRHFAVVGGWTVVALERGHELVTVDRDGRVAARLDLPSPACVLPVR
ncbi:lactonase family protein [Cellulomonas alba]|uniref:Beta-propeller fold lactonase family protein n=1 Tax=Cellulomonas alba TaxID=3053467 RepID=A0ABT7SII2_9CELL|nr:beta-propeller fold lactonase family protein [Cellulomonas alba]MDM7855374.1 beta-propeller fold lactonase family protein [Cellulomonas alba]